MRKRDKNMKHADIIQLPLLVKDILTENSDSSHLVTMSEIRAILLDSGIEADRRSVYKAINVLNEHGYEVFYEARGGKQGYWIRHPLTLAEALFICDSIQTSSALSEETASSFSSKVASLLSVHEQDKLPDTISSLARTENDHVLRLIEILLNAIADRNPVEFRYYDIGVTKKKQYRKQNKIYHLVPYAIISHNGRYYCVFYSESHHSFANYRIDKMDMVKVLDEQADPVFFSLNDHVRASFNMYHGEPETVTVLLVAPVLAIVKVAVWSPVEVG